MNGKQGRVQGKKKRADKKETLVSRVAKLEEQFRTQQEEVVQLYSQLKEFQEKYKYEKEIRSNRIFGVTVMKRKFKTGGHTYEKWFGFFRRDGKQYWIYIGGDPRKVEEKIKGWLKKKGFWKFMGKEASGGDVASR